MTVIPTPEAQPTMTVREASRAIGSSYEATMAAVRRGELPSFKVGRRYFVPTAALRRILALEGGGST